MFAHGVQRAIQIENGTILLLHLCLEIVFYYSIQYHYHKNRREELYCNTIKKNTEFIAQVTY